MKYDLEVHVKILNVKKYISNSLQLSIHSSIFSFRFFFFAWKKMCSALHALSFNLLLIWKLIVKTDGHRCSNISEECFLRHLLRHVLTSKSQKPWFHLHPAIFTSSETELSWPKMKTNYIHALKDFSWFPLIIM